MSEENATMNGTTTPTTGEGAGAAALVADIEKTKKKASTPKAPKAPADHTHENAETKVDLGTLDNHMPVSREPMVDEAPNGTTVTHY